MVHLRDYDYLYCLAEENIEILELFTDVVPHLFDRLLNGNDDARLGQLFVLLLMDSHALRAQRKQTSEASAETSDYLSRVISTGGIGHFSLLSKNIEITLKIYKFVYYKNSNILL